ncbi:anillin-like [Mya arenaria]|uniref:anillin-like n=1 Tax=Mya arenaria TaxID=6604 RepID=UPI0022E2BC2F|nr:anillin-like [Mya arenaria]
MDSYTEQLIERTRQRRAMLNQKLGKTPDPAPRKRVLEDTTNQPVLTVIDDDDSPKRHCTWETDGKGKPDTPAIKGVKSRMTVLSEERPHFSDVGGDQRENRAGTHVAMDTRPEPAGSPSSRRSRFAKLAQNLDNFECDMSHPTIKKQEEKKPRWQPPKKDDDRPPNHFDAKDRHVSSPQKEYELYQGPKRDRQGSGPGSPAPSPKKTPAPAPPSAPLPTQTTAPAKPPRAQSPVRAQSPARPPLGSPKKSTHTVHLSQPGNTGSPKYAHSVKTVTNHEPVNKRATDTSLGDEPTEKPVTDRLASWKKNTPTKPAAPRDPTDLPLSERFAGWEQRVSQTPKADNTPARRHQQTPRPEQRPAQGPDSGDDISAKPVSDIRASWKEQEAKTIPKREEEPTAYSVGDRMSAWENMTSNNKVSSIKKVDPGTPGPMKPSGTPSKAASWKTNGTPNKGLTPQKSFKDSIEERASQMGRGKGSTSSADGLPPKPPTSSTSRSPQRTPSKAGAFSPTKVPSPQAASPLVRVGSATKTLQQKILNQVQYSKTDKIADKIRQERMAEVNTLNNRYQNGILKDDRTLEQSEVSSADEANVHAPPPPPPPAAGGNKRESVRTKARDDFNKKLQAMGFELSDEGGASYTFDNGPGETQPASASKKPSSIYRLVSKKCTEEEKPVVQQSASSLKKVQFQEHNTSTDTMDETEDDFDPTSEETQSESQESFDDTFDSGSESSIPESYKSASRRMDNQQSPQKRVMQHHQMDDDDVSLSAFVSDSVRRQTVMPQAQDDTASITSEDSMEYQHVRLEGVSHRPQGYGSSISSSEGERGGQDHMDGDSDDEDRQEMDDLLDEALDDITDVEMRNKEPVPQPRKRQSHLYATTSGEMSLQQPNNNEVTMRAKSDGLAYSVSMYRTSRQLGTEVPTVSQRIARNSHWTHESPVEEDIPMPRQLPPELERKTLQDRVKELNELVTQEQNVIMQTSNAINKCCMGDSQFAGSAEQVECNRLLLVACQKRQAYLTEAQRLKETRQLEAPGQQGPKGSLTISDIRLPLKKDFVTKIGTASDTTTHYFVILIRNGPQVITTQMLSTHDPLMRGSLDFPNLIKIHGISSNFNINLEIYSMSVSREHQRDKKKKTPKKHKHQTNMPLESPGGPLAVRTTSFFLITALPITMKSLDKSSFSLERIPFLSPLHGTIYMRLKCMMEQHVEERGFLTMFEDVSGLGSWHRRWCALTGNKLCYWKYPDDETKKDPIGYIDLKRVITEKIGLIPRDICARPHTFELVSVRPPLRGEQDTLVTKTYNTMTTTRFMLSADTKEERIVWCNKINRSLANIRTWHADALRPIRPR